MKQEFCPDCIVQMKKQSKKLGGLSVWMVCPKCGYRTRPENESFQTKTTGKFLDNIKRSNKNGGKLEIEEEL